MFLVINPMQACQDKTQTGFPHSYHSNTILFKEKVYSFLETALVYFFNVINYSNLRHSQSLSVYISTFYKVASWKCADHFVYMITANKSIGMLHMVRFAQLALASSPSRLNVLINTWQTERCTLSREDICSHIFIISLAAIFGR